MTKMGYECYVPTQTEIHQWSDCKKKIERIVIPMVIFVSAEQVQETELKTLSFIYKFISYPGSTVPAVIPTTQIEQFRFMLGNADSSVIIETPLHIGDHVKIIRGPLLGQEGKLCVLKDKKQAVAITLDCFGYACVETSICDVKVIN